MSNSGFNLGQTGNATEVGAGVVKLATQAQIDTKQAEDGGIPLVATPDKMPSQSLVNGLFNAYEDLSKGDVVGLSYFYSVPDAYAQDTDIDLQESITPTKWVAQRITVPVLSDPWVDITSIQVRGVSNTGNSAYVQLLIRETLTGADVYTGPQVFANGFGVVFGLSVDPDVVGLVPGNSYYFILKEGNPTNNVHTAALNNTPGVYPPGGQNEAWVSTDSGANWTNLGADISVNFYIGGYRTDALGHWEVFKASAASLTSNRFAFFGVVTEDALTGNPVKIEGGRLYNNLFTGLTPGETYYLQDTNGAIGETPGTLAIPIGRAVSATSIYRDFHLSPPILISGGTYYVQTEIDFIHNENGALRNIQLAPRIDYEAGDILYSTNWVFDTTSYKSIRANRGDRVIVEAADQQFVRIVYPS